MKKFYILLVALFVMNGANAQWVPQYSGISYNLNSVYFTDSNTGYAVGAYTILKTSDGGTNWLTQSHPPWDWAGFFSIYFTNTDTGYIAGAIPSGSPSVPPVGLMWKTTDGGTNWVYNSAIGGNGFSSVHFPKKNTGYALGCFIEGAFWNHQHFVIKTTDGGSNWWNCHTFSLYPYYHSVHFSSVDTGYVVGDNRILKTIDGGTNWDTMYYATSNYLLSIDFANADIGYAVGYSYIDPAYTGLILKTKDGGTNWVTQYSGTGSPLKSVYFTSVDTGYAVGDSGTILNTTDGGINWVTQNSGTDVNLYSVHFPSVDTGYAVGDSGTILKTTNGGLYVGLKDLSSKSNNLKIYPNPSSTKVTIETTTKGQLFILNLNGEQLLVQEITGTKTQLDVSNLSSGIYFLKATGEKAVQFGKFFKN